MDDFTEFRNSFAELIGAMMLTGRTPREISDRLLDMIEPAVDQSIKTAVERNIRYSSEKAAQVAWKKCHDMLCDAGPECTEHPDLALVVNIRYEEDN